MDGPTLKDRIFKGIQLSHGGTSISIEELKVGIFELNLKSVKTVFKTPLGDLEVKYKLPSYLTGAVKSRFEKFMKLRTVFSPKFTNITKEKTERTIARAATVLDVPVEELTKRIYVSLHDPFFFDSLNRKELDLHLFIFSIAQAMRMDTDHLT
jgi:hypothetical protein